MHNIWRFVGHVLTGFQAQCLKVHFLNSHVDYCHENLEAYSDEDITTMEKRYQEKIDVNMVVDYCWMLKR